MGEARGESADLTAAVLDGFLMCSTHFSPCRDLHEKKQINQKHKLNNMIEILIETVDISSLLWGCVCVCVHCLFLCVTYIYLSGVSTSPRGVQPLGACWKTFTDSLLPPQCGKMPFPKNILLKDSSSHWEQMKIDYSHSQEMSLYRCVSVLQYFPTCSRCTEEVWVTDATCCVLCFKNESHISNKSCCFLSQGL